jgi:NifB/MoaA-like Fe-S oxidoreductase
VTRRQIAKKLGLTLAQVRRAEKSGLRKLRAMLEERGITAEMIKSVYKDTPDEMNILKAVTEESDEEITEG